MVLVIRSGRVLCVSDVLPLLTPRDRVSWSCVLVVCPAGRIVCRIVYRIVSCEHAKHCRCYIRVIGWSHRVSRSYGLVIRSGHTVWSYGLVVWSAGRIVALRSGEVSTTWI